MTDTTTAAKLTAGARIMVHGTDGDSIALARPADLGEAVEAEVSFAEKTGRKVVITTDRGQIEVGGAAKVLLAPLDTPAEEVEEVGMALPVAEASAPIIATVTTDTAGRLTHFSKLRIDRAGTVYERPVPWKVDEPAGATAPVRLTATLEDMGYRPRGLWQRTPDGKTWCEVLPLTPGEVVE